MIIIMEFPLNKRARSSFSNESKTASILAKSFLIRDDIKQKLLHQRQIDFAVYKEYKKDLEKRSARRFCKSPFMVNILADNEIQEHKRKIKDRTKKCSSLSKNLNKGKDTCGYLKKLRQEIRKVSESNSNLGEKSIGSRLKAEITEQKLEKARKDRIKMRKDLATCGMKITEGEDSDDFDTFWADC